MSVKLDFSILDGLQATNQEDNTPSDKRIYYKLEARQLANEITRGIQAGEALESLLLKAIECISLMTGDNSFYEQNKNNLKDIYGINTESASIMEIISAEELEDFLNN